MATAAEVIRLAGLSLLVVGVPLAVIAAIAATALSAWRSGREERRREANFAALEAEIAGLVAGSRAYRAQLRHDEIFVVDFQGAALAIDGGEAEIPAELREAIARAIERHGPLPAKAVRAIAAAYPEAIERAAARRRLSTDAAPRGTH